MISLRQHAFSLAAVFIALRFFHAGLTGAAAGAAGLVLGTALKMAQKIKPTPLSMLVGAGAFAALGMFEWPLVPVVCVLVPIGVIAAAFERRA